MKIAAHVMAAILASEWAIEASFLDAIIAVANRNEPILGPISTRKVDKPSAPCTRDGNIGILNIVGPIIRYGGSFQEACTGAVSLDTLTTAYQNLLADDSIDGILINIDSPGGQASGVAEFADMIRAGCKKKKTMAYTGGSMASAAYWIGSAVEHITAAETAFVGSIGVVVSVNKRSDDEMVVTNTKSPKKALDPASEDGRAYIIQHVDSLADVFYKKVSEYRNTPVAKVVSDFGQGGVMIAAEALTAGMVDAVGNFDTALKTLKENIMSVPKTVDELTAASPELVAQITADATAKAEAKVMAEMQAKIDASAQEAVAAKATAEDMRKTLLSQKLIAAAGQEVGTMLMGFDGALTESQLTDLAGVFKTKDEALAKFTADMGAPKGTQASTADVPDAASADRAAVAKLMSEGLTETEALIRHEENKVKGA